MSLLSQIICKTPYRRWLIGQNDSLVGLHKAWTQLLQINTELRPISSCNLWQELTCCCLFCHSLSKIHTHHTISKWNEKPTIALRIEHGGVFKHVVQSIWQKMFPHLLVFHSLRQLFHSPSNPGTNFAWFGLCVFSKAGKTNVFLHLPLNSS